MRSLLFGIRGPRKVTIMRHFLFGAFLFLSACTEPLFQPVSSPVETLPAETLDPTPPPPPPPTARTVEQFDTTTEEDRAAAIAPVQSSGERSLGTTNVSLGSAADPGIWLKTALVSELQMGRAVSATNGNSVNLELRPSGGEAGSASQMSLAAMRLLEIPLTALADVEVFAN